MKKIILLVFVSFLINRISAQPYITSTVQVSNPSPCTLCCNGSIGYSINSYSCYTFPPVKIGLQSPTTGTVIQWNPNMSNLCNGTYTVIVDFMNSSSCGAVLVCSINYIFTTELKNNISENHKEIIIYPNPAYDLLNVKFETFNNEI